MNIINISLILFWNYVKQFECYNSKKEFRLNIMKTRSHVYGDKNVVGKNIERLRKERHIKQKDFIAKLQLEEVDINPTSYSKLEGQLRIATDKEIFAIAKVLNVKIEELF